MYGKEKIYEKTPIEHLLGKKIFMSTFYIKKVNLQIEQVNVNKNINNYTNLNKDGRIVPEK